MATFHSKIVSRLYTRQYGHNLPLEIHWSTTNNCRHLLWQKLNIHDAISSGRFFVIYYDSCMVDDPIFNCQIDVSFGPFIHVFSVVCLVERAMMFPLSTWMSFVLVSASNKQTVSFCIALVDYLWCKFTCHKIFIE